MFYLFKKNYIAFSAFLSLIVLILVYVSEFFLNLPPCKLCYYQRIPYFLVLFFFPLSFFLKESFFLHYIFFILFFVSLIIALFHSLLERGFIDFNIGCVSGNESFSNIKELRQYLEEVPITKCDEIIFSIFGLSFANLNMILSLLLNIFNLYFFLELYEKKKIFR